MTLTIRADLLKMALDDADTRRKLNFAPSWDDCIAVLKEFAERKGWKVVQL